MAMLILVSVRFDFAWIKYIIIFKLILIISLIYSSYKINCKEYTHCKGICSKLFILSFIGTKNFVAQE